jgi:Domain of unknown function (DUF4411)
MQSDKRRTNVKKSMAAVDNDRTLYVIDSSGWISIDGRPDHDRILWHVLQLVEQGQVRSPPEVWDELVKCHHVLSWIRDHRAKIVIAPTEPAYLSLVGDIAYRFPRMCATRGSREKADPYVVAMATHLNRTTNRRHHVVAKETTANRPNGKIPTACAAYKTDCEGIFDMLTREFPNESW